MPTGAEIIGKTPQWLKNYKQFWARKRKDGVEVFI